MDAHVLIPAYQPDNRLVKLVDELVGRGFDVTVVDDGCTGCDGVFTAVAERSNVTIWHHERNQGKGQALRTGLSHLFDADPKGFVVTADADGQHLPKDIAAVAQATLDNPTSLVLGTRRFDTMPLRSRMGNTIIRFVVNRRCGTHMGDVQTGLRGFSLAAAPKLLTVPGDRYEYEMSMLLSSRKIFDGIVEVPIDVVYNGNNDDTHLTTVRDGLRILKAALAHRE